MASDPVSELFEAHAEIQRAASRIAVASRVSIVFPKELAKLAGEIQTMACVTEIVAYAVKDESHAGLPS
jgi:hypothetical protein